MLQLVQYAVQCHCERPTTILCIEVIGKMSISTNNWICILASSATVERLFSTCGAIIRATRARLTAKTVEELLFKMENNAVSHLSTAALQELDFLENEELTVDSFIPIILLHTVAYALLKILNVCRAVAIFVRLDYIN